MSFHEWLSAVKFAYGFMMAILVVMFLLGMTVYGIFYLLTLLGAL